MNIGIDLGTANVLVHVEGKGIVIQEPSVVAVDDDGRIRAVGEDAREMIGRTPGNIHAIRPMKDGVIADYVITEAMLRFFINKATSGRMKLRLSGPNVMISVPAGVTSVEKRAVKDAALKAGAREAYLIEEPLAAAIGANVPISGPSGNMVIDIGGGTSEVADIALGGIVVSTSLRVGGNRFDESIASYIRKKYNLMIGERTAEEVKITIGTALPLERELSMEVRGRDLIAGLPRTIPITSSEVMEAIELPLQQLVAAVRHVLEQTPPELSSYIRKKYNLMIGERTAEEVKITIGTALPLERELSMEVRGRDLIAGLPRTIPITSSEVMEAIELPLQQLVAAVRHVLEQTPPELSSDIIDKGMVMSGGGALLRNIDKLLTQVTGVPCHVAENAMDCVALGTGEALKHYDFFKKSLVQSI
jgi:rod shape-determining protein MreB and related proteins